MQTSSARFRRRNSISLEESLHFLTGGKSLPCSCSVSGVCVLSGGILIPILRLCSQSHLFWSLWISRALLGSSAASWAVGIQCCCTVVGLFVCGILGNNSRRRHLHRTQWPCLPGWSKSGAALIYFIHLYPTICCQSEVSGNLLAFDASPTSFTIMGLSLFYSLSVLSMGSQEKEEIQVWALSVNLNLKQEAHTVNGDVILPLHVWHS